MSCTTISSPGIPVQCAMEDRMGDSFSDVQVHTGPKAVQACDDINAKAFTVGNNIAFNQGEYDPGSAEGQHTIAHELTHVRQQTGGAVSMLPQDDLDLEIDPDPELEQEAEETAQRMMQGGELGIQRMSETDVHVQRMPPWEELEEHRDSVQTEGESDSEQRKVEQANAALEEKFGGNPFEDIEGTEVLKAIGSGLLGEIPGGSVTGEVIGTMEEEASRIDQLQEDIQQIDPPSHWVTQISDRAATKVIEQQTGEGDSTGDINMDEEY